MKTNDVRQSIIKTCDGIKEMLLAKNADYGNSALDPIRVFSSVDNIEQIKVRLDDKLSRIKNLQGKEGKVQSESNMDTIKDTVGYLILLLIAIDSVQDKDE